MSTLREAIDKCGNIEEFLMPLAQAKLIQVQVLQEKQLLGINSTQASEVLHIVSLPENVVESGKITEITRQLNFAIFKGKNIVAIGEPVHVPQQYLSEGNKGAWAKFNQADVSIALERNPFDTSANQFYLFKYKAHWFKLKISSLRAEKLDVKMLPTRTVMGGLETIGYDSHGMITCFRFDSKEKTLLGAYDIDSRAKHHAVNLLPELLNHPELQNVSFGGTDYRIPEERFMSTASYSYQGEIIFRHNKTGDSYRLLSPSKRYLVEPNLDECIEVIEGKSSNFSLFEKKYEALGYRDFIVQGYILDEIDRVAKAGQKVIKDAVDHIIENTVFPKGFDQLACDILLDDRKAVNEFVSSKLKETYGKEV